MVQQPGHNVHFHSPTMTKAGKKSMLPRLKVFFLMAVSRGGKLTGHFLNINTYMGYMGVYYARHVLHIL